MEKTKTGGAAAKKPAAKKTTEAKKPAAKKTAVKKAVPKKEAPKKEAPVLAADIETKVILQFGEISIDNETLLQNVENYLKYDRDMPPVDQKNVAVYVKPEEGRAYVVVDGQEEGSLLL